MTKPPIHLMGAVDAAPLCAGPQGAERVKQALRGLLPRLHEALPQFPADPKKLARLESQVLAALTTWAADPQRSTESLVRALAKLTIKGLGDANATLPWLFGFSTAPATTDGGATPIDLVHSPRSELVGRLRLAFEGYFRGRPAALEWAVATLAAWRPRSLAELHALLERADGPFLPLEVFAASWSAAFRFPAADADRRPDWTLYWEGHRDSAYGGEYPPSVQSFLAGFFERLGSDGPAGPLLDIGAGNHAAARLAATVSPELEIYDIDVAVIGPPPEDVPVRSARMKAEQLAFASGAFRAVISVNGLEYADRELGVRELGRVLSPGGEGALVLHRPDSAVIERARALVRYIEDSCTLETLSLMWSYFFFADSRLREPLARRLQALAQARPEGPARHPYFDHLLEQMNDWLQAGIESRAEVLPLVEECERVLRWTWEKNRFMATHVAAVAKSEQHIREWLEPAGLRVTEMRELRDTGGEDAAIGWGVRFEKARAGSRADEGEAERARS